MGDPVFKTKARGPRNLGLQNDSRTTRKGTDEDLDGTIPSRFIRSILLSAIPDVNFLN